MYHAPCYTRFFFRKKHPDAILALNDEPASRPADAGKLKSYLEMCDWFENNSDADLYSLQELHQHMLIKTGDENLVYSVKSLKRKLIEWFGDHVFFGEVFGRRDIVCL